jgi:hypothetical protein
MEIIYDKIENNEVVDSIVADADFVATLKGTWKLRDAPVPETEEEIARNWRNEELYSTDWIVPLTDHPERNDYITYRTKLRDWPSTSNFPDTKPTL